MIRKGSPYGWRVELYWWRLINRRGTYTIKRLGSLEGEVSEWWAKVALIRSRQSHGGAGESAVADGENTGNGDPKVTGGHSCRSVSNSSVSYEGGQYVT